MADECLENNGDCLTFGRVWRGSGTLGELIVASPARRQRPGHPRLSHLSSSYLPLGTPADFETGRDTGNASTRTSDVVQACPTARLLPAGAAVHPHGPFCDRKETRSLIVSLSLMNVDAIKEFVHQLFQGDV